MSQSIQHFLLNRYVIPLCQHCKMISKGFFFYLVSHVILHSETKEYCWETFNATCADNEVILITSARYGRMKLGRCLSRDYYVGCSADVMPQADKICSGRHSCEMSIPDTSLHKLQPCPKDLLAYLEASYTCIQGKK